VGGFVLFLLGFFFCFYFFFFFYFVWSVVCCNCSKVVVGIGGKRGVGVVVCLGMVMVFWFCMLSF